MNLYHSAMEHCALPEGLEQRLRERALHTPPVTARAVFRPRGFAPKALLAAILAVVFTVSVGAVVAWDAVFQTRFGRGAAATPMAEAAFQDVNVSAVCGNVTVTVRQALSDDKTIYLVLDYQLPDAVDRAAVAAAQESETAFVRPPEISFYATGDVNWTDVAEAAQGTDWADPTAALAFRPLSPLAPYAFHGGSSSGGESRGYDSKTNTLTYLQYFTTEGTQTLSAQPLTLLVTPPVLETGGALLPLSDTPATITFQPAYTAQTLSGSTREEAGIFHANVTLSPFAICVETRRGIYADVKALRQDTALVLRSGETLAISSLSASYGGSSSGPSDKQLLSSASFTAHFSNLLDVRTVKAVRIGDVEISLS
ncbi:DUF4179 domain-containing protein [Oscillibacter sp.]|uniref:DUF4179 domain-containing protein n=1 Tax=Oscillibacter sp. TaxID=1945593 RepID=UPI0026073630|nr:DUF4179 domain-containing protein [Oscillibacter sp.]MDD3346714.1 DUF4179 domain-containing protein [Oscillibacter sp.]